MRVVKGMEAVAIPFLQHPDIGDLVISLPLNKHDLQLCTRPVVFSMSDRGDTHFPCNLYQNTTQEKCNSFL